MPLALLLSLLLPPGSLRVQENVQGALPVEIRDLRAVPRDVADEVQRLFSAGGTRRIDGDFTVGPRDTIAGNLAILNGTLVIEGYVAGAIVAVDANVFARPRSRVAGAVTIIGGRLAAPALSTIDGAVRVFSDRVRVERQADRLVVRDESEDEAWYRRRMSRPEHAGTELRLVTARTYNRVEGLPLLVGPRLRQPLSWGRITMDAMGILRSADRFELRRENLGHQVRAEIQLGGSYGVRIGGQVDDVVESVEDWSLSDQEVGIASFILHRDYRDYYNRSGPTLRVSGFAGEHLEASLAWSDERWGAREDRDPWSLLRDNQHWRTNPQLDVGRFHLIRADVRFDTRNDASDPWSGWFVTGAYEYGTGRISDYGPTTQAVRDINPTGRTVYDRLFLDVRRYNRVSADGQVNLRMVFGGWLSGDELPLQRRFAVGGPGTIPGYDFRQVRPGTDFLTCAGTRDAGVPGGPRSPVGIPAQCERFVLGQAEYRGEIRSHLFGLLDEERRRRRLGWGRAAEWVVFADVGRGWLVGPRVGDLQYPASSLPSPATMRADVGVGVRLDDLGLYIAKSVTDGRSPVNFLARLRPRF